MRNNHLHTCCQTCSTDLIVSKQFLFYACRVDKTKRWLLNANALVCDGNYPYSIKCMYSSKIIKWYIFGIWQHWTIQYHLVFIIITNMTAIDLLIDSLRIVWKELLDFYLFKIKKVLKLWIKVVKIRKCSKTKFHCE